MRHGQTAGNLRRAYIGRTDEPLCEQGRTAALRAGTMPQLQRVYVSPLLRARQTAQLCFPNARQIAVEGLREMDFGDFEGRTAQEMEDDAAYRAWLASYCEDPCPHGEQRARFTERCAAAFTQLLSEELGHGAQQLAVVAHGGTIMAIMSSFAVPRRGYFDWQVGNCEGYRAQLEPGAPGTAPLITNPHPFTRLS